MKIIYYIYIININDNNNNQEHHEYLSDIQSITNECYDDDDSSIYNKRRCTSSDVESIHSNYTQNTGNNLGINMPSVPKNNGYNSGNMTMLSNNSQNMPLNIPPNNSMNKNMNISSRNGSPGNQSFNNNIDNGSYNNSPRSMTIPISNQRNRSLNNQSQSLQQNQIQGIENSNHSRTSSLSTMNDSKRNSMGYSISPINNKYPPSQSSSSNVGIPNEINRSSRPLSAQNGKKIQRFSNTSYLNSPNSLEMETEQMNQPITEPLNQNFLSVDNQINNNMERNVPQMSSVPNYYPNQSFSNRTESIRSAPSFVSNSSNFTLSGINNDNSSQRSFSIKNNNNEDMVNRNNTYPLNKNMVERNEQNDPQKSYTIPKDHSRNVNYKEEENEIEFYSNNDKQNSISYLLNPLQGKRMQEQMMPNDMDIS